MRDKINSTKRICVSIVVPLYNEMQSLPLLRTRLKCLSDCLRDEYDLELCLVDDGSVDGTHEQMMSVVPSGVNCVGLHHERNKGIGAATRTGLDAATGDIVCTIDGDCSYPPEELKTLIERVRAGIADVAVASPYHPQGAVIGVNVWRLFLSIKCSQLYRRLSPLKMYTYTSIFRAYNKAALKGLEFRSDGFVSAVEILLSVHRRGLSVTEVPMILRARSHGRSKIRIASTIMAHLVMLCRTVTASLLACSSPVTRDPLQVRASRDRGTVFPSVERNNPAS